MRRIAAALLTLTIALGGKTAFAQTIATINSAAPTSVISGSGDTVITLTLRQSNTTRYNVCFYSGATSASIVPTTYNFANAPATVMYTFTVPGARFQTGTAAATDTIYLAAAGASVPNGCTGTNQGISNLFQYNVTASGYALRTVTPSTLASGSATTNVTLTGVFPTFPTNGSGLGLCFYAGANNTPLLPTNQTSTSTISFSVPAATFASPATARIYLATASSTCTGSNTAYSNSLSYTITQGQRFIIDSSYPSSLPAGGGNVAVSLYGNLQGTGIPNNGVCIYTGPNTTPTAITPTSFTTTEIDFVVPASALQIPPASFASGTYNAQVQLGAANGACTTTAQGVSNVYTLPVSYPTISSASAIVLPQVNLNSNYTYLPTNIELYGTNFGSKFSGRFIPAGGTQFETTGLYVDQFDATVQLLRPSSNTATTAVYACNYSLGNVYEYCSTSPYTITNHALATSSTQIASSVPTPSPGQATTLTATITPGAGSTTAGGTFIPGPPTGTVTFSDNGTSLGTAPLVGTSLSLSKVSTQSINIYAGVDASPVPITGMSRADAKAIARPNETPSPDTNSQFSTLIADFNKDGINDTLVIQSNTGIFHLFLGGSPLGTIQSEQTIYPNYFFNCSSLSGVTVADFNGDGYPDIAFLCGDSGGYSNLLVSLNAGDGSFPNPATRLGYFTGNQLAAADVNKDGKIDLVLTGNIGTFCCTGETFAIQTFLGDGTGNFTAGPTTSTADLAGTQIVLKDLNNDGAADIALLHYNTTTSATEVAIWQNSGSGSFTRLTALPICNCTVTNTKLFVTPLVTSSLYPDIVVFYAEGSSLLSFTNKKTAAIAFNTPISSLYSNLNDVVLGDFTGDGFVDAAHYNGTNISIEIGNGQGTFLLNPSTFGSLTTGTGDTNLVSLATAPDLNGDGLADLVAIFPSATVNPNSSSIVSYVTTGTAVASLPTTLNTAGSRTITTVFTGNRNVLGSNGSQAITVGRAAPTITWNPATTTNTTTALGSTILNATASVPGTFAYTPAAGSYLAAGTQTITAVFTPTDTSTYSVVTTTRNVTVSKTTPVVTTTINPGNHTYTPNLATTYSVIVTGANIVPTGNVQANNNGSPVGSLAGLSQSGTNQSSTQILFSSLPAGTFGFTGTYQGDAVYNAVTSAITNYTVSKSTPTVTYTPTPTSIAYGTGLVANQLNATAVDPNTGASVPGTVTYSTPSISNLQTGSLLPVGANVVTASFLPTDATDYNTSTKTGTITVTKTTPSITYTPTPTSITYGTGLVANQLNATAVDPATGAAVPGTFTYSTPGFTSLQTGSILPAGSNVITASFVPTDTTNYGSASKTATVTVATATTTTAVSVSPTNIAPGQSVRISVTVTPNPAGTAVTGLVNFTDDNGPGTQVTLSNGTGSINYTPANSGTHNLSAAYAGTVNYSPSSSATPATFTVTTITPTVTYTPTPTSIVYGTALIASQLNATAIDPSTSATVPGTFSYSSGTLTNLQPGNMLPTGSNTVTAAFTPSSATYANASKSAVITVTPVSTTTILAVTPTSISVGQSSRLQATITANSGIYGVSQGTVTFSDDNGTIPNATGQLIGGITVVDYSPTNVGTHRITAAYSGSANFSASSTATPISLLVTQKTPRLTYSPTPASISYGTALIAGQLNATALDAATGAAVPGVFDYSTPSIPGVGVGTILPAGANVVTARFTPTDTTNYATATQPATITVTQFTPNITWAASTISFGTALSSTQLNAVANDINGTAIPGTYSYNPTAGTILPVGANPVAVTFTPTNTTNFATATATRTITVIRTATVTTLSINPATIAVGQSSTITATVTPTSGAGPVTGQVSFTDSLGTISPAQVTLVNGVATFSYTPTAVGTHVITVSFPNTTNYSASSAGGNLVVGQGVPVINFTPNPATIPYGTPLSAAQLNAVETTGTILGAFSYSSPLGTVLNTGANTLTATFTPTDTTSYSTVTKTAVVTVTQFTPVIAWTTPASIPFGTPLSATQLNAVANDVNGTAVPGTYSYNPAAGTVLPLGTTQDTLTFTPTSTQNFATATATRAITVVAASTTTALNINPGTITLGQSTILTATVAPTVGTAAVTGSVTFTDSRGTIPSGTVTLSNGIATLSYTPTTNGSHTITATYSGSTNYSASAGVGTLAVGQGLPVITFAPNPATIVYGTPLSAAQLNAVQTTSIPGAFSYSSPLGTILPVGANIITATFTPTDTTSYATVTKTATITVTQAIPTITWNPPASTLANIPLDTTILNATASVPGTFAYTPAASSYLNFGTATLNLLFTPTDNTNYQTASATRTIAVGKANPTPILLTASPASQTAPNLPVVFTVSIPGTNITPTGIVRLFESTTLLGSGSVTQATGHNGIASITVSTLTSGVHSIVANIAADAIYNEATSAPLAYNVGGATVPITFTPNPATIPYGTPLSAAQLNATASVPGTFSYSPALGAILNAGANTITATFTPTDTATYATATKTAVVTVTQLTPTITFLPNPATIPYGTPLSAAQLNATSSTPGTFTYSPALGTILNTGVNTITATFTPTDTTNYTTATRTAVVTVTQTAPTLTFLPNPATISYGTPLSAAQLNATSPIPGTFTYSPAVGAILNTGANIITATFTPTDTTNYATATKTAVVTVTQGTPVITFLPNPATIPYGTPLSAAQLNAVQTTSITGAFLYSQPLGTILSVGQTILTATFTPTDTTNYATVFKTATITVTQASATITWNPATTTTTTNPVDATLLNATSSIPGAFAYTPALGDFLPAGTQTLTAIFTPTDTTNYAPVNTTRTVTVTKSALSAVLSANPASLSTPGQATLTVLLTGLNLNPTGSVQFFDGATSLGTSKLPQPSAGILPQASPSTGSLSVSLPVTLTSGPHSFLAQYAGDIVYFATPSNTLPYTVGGTTPPITFVPNPATIPYGTPLSAAQLDATSTVPGTFTYSPALGAILNAGVQTITATFTPTDSFTYAIVTKTATVTVTPFTPVIAWTTPAAVPFGTPLSAAQLNAVAKDLNGTTVPGTYSYAPAAPTVLPLGITQDTVTFTPTNTTNFNTATATIPITVTSTNTTTTLTLSSGSIDVGQSVTLTASVTPTIGTGPVTGQVAFTDNRGTITPAQVTLINGVATLTYTPTTAGTHLLSASYLGTSTYNTSATTVPAPLAVGQVTPVITFVPNPATIVYGTPLSAAQLDAVQTTSIPGVFSYSPALGAILPVGANTITATFTPTDTTNYGTVAKTAIVTVTQATPVITFVPNPATIVYGTPLSAAQLDAVQTTTIPGVFSYSPTLGAILPVGANTITATFTPTDTLNYATVAKTAIVTVTQASPVITFVPNPATIVYGTPLSAAQLDAVQTTSIPGAFTYSPALNTILNVGANTITATFTPTDTTSYATVTRTAVVTVTQAAPVITFLPNPATIVYGTPLSASQLNAVQTTSIPGTFTYSQTLGTILNVGQTLVTATFTPTDTTNYSTVIKTATLTVTQATPVITWNPAATTTTTTPVDATLLNATATVPGAFVYTPALGTYLPAGRQTLSTTFTPTDALNYAPVTTTAVTTVAKTATTALLSANPGSLSAPGTPTVLTALLSGINITPTGTLQFFDGTNPIGTVSITSASARNATATLSTTLAAGTHTLLAVYNGDPVYLTATSNSLPYSVGGSAVPITFLPNPATIVYGTPLSAAQLNATSPIPGTFAYSPAAGTILPTGINTITATFTPTDAVNYQATTQTATVTVTQATPTITWNPNPATIPYGTPLSAAQLNATTPIPGTFTYSPALGTILNTGVNTITANFIPTDTLNYTSATQTAIITVLSTGSTTTLALTAGGGSTTTVPTGTVITLTATVAATTSPIRGQVNFCDTAAPTCTGAAILGSAQLTDAGTATLRLIPAIGVHVYKAVFLGTRTNVASTSTGSTLLVTGTYPTTTTFTSTGDTGNFTLTAVITATGGPTLLPSGTVSFLDTSNANAPLTSAALGSQGLAQSFTNQSTTASGVTGSLQLAADLNNDGIPDLITGTPVNPDSSDSTQIFTISLGNGDGTFTTKSTLPSQGAQVVVADFNHDGILDLAVPNAAGTSLFILFGTGDGTFTLNSTQEIPAGNGNLLAGDFNHDGIVDLITGSDIYNTTTNTTTGALTTLLGAGDGTFSTTRSTTPTGASGIVSNDFNGDGLPDLFATGSVGTGGTSASVLLGKGDGTFATKTTLTVQNGDIFGSTDLNKDGIADLASVNFYDSSISTYLGNGDGTFTFKANYPNPTANQSLYDSFRIAFADVNSDGNPDIVTVADNGVFIFNGAGDGTVGITYQTVPQTDTGEDFGLAIADFNNDGHTDVATTAHLFADSSSHVILSLNTIVANATAIATNVAPTGNGSHLVTANYSGDASFQPSVSTPIDLSGRTFIPTFTWFPQALTLGTPLSASQLNAVARGVDGNILPGTFTYTPAAGTILPVGRQPLSLFFTPADLVDYIPATVTTTVLVNPLATATALTATPNPAAFGQSITLTATTTPTSAFSTPITGPVTFLDGTALLGTTQSIAGIATLPVSTLSVGNHALTATYSGDTAGNFTASTSPVLTQVVSTTIPLITWTPNPATIPYGTKLSAAQLNATARTATGTTIPGVFTYSPALGATLPAGTQTLTTTFTPTDTTRYASTTATALLTVTRATPAIAWSTPAPINQGTALTTTQLNATATGIDSLALPGTFTYTPAAGTILPAGTQTLTVNFTPSDATDYIATTASVVLSVLNPTTTTVLTTSLTPAQFGQPITLTATVAASARTTTPLAGTVTFFDGPTQLGTPVALTATPTGTTAATLPVSTLGVGNHQLTALYANDPAYGTSTSLPLAQTITIAPTTLAWTPTVATIPYGTPLSAAQLNAVPTSPYVSNVTGLLTYTPAAGAILNAGPQTLTATFTPTDTIDFLPAAGAASITVTQATPTLTWPTPAAITQGTPLSATQLNASAIGINNTALPGTFTYTPAAGAILQPGVTTLRVLFTPTDTLNYTTATASVPLTVTAPGTATTLASSLNPSQSGQAVTFIATVTQTGTSTVPLTGTVTFFDGTTLLATSPLSAATATYTTATLSATTHTLRAVFNGTPDYTTSTSNPLIQSVTSAATGITWLPNPATIPYGTPLSAAQLNATATSTTGATVPGTFTYTPAAGTILTAGTQTLTATFTPTDLTTATRATASTTIIVTRATPTLTWPTPAATAVGTALSATQLNATATGINNTSLPGTFTYTPAAGTLVTSGPQVLSVLFTPTDTVDYTTATATVTLNGSALTLTSLSTTTAFLGDPAKTITLTGIGFVTNSIARANGTALTTTYVNPTTLTAVLPASRFLAVQTFQITVNNPTQNQTTAALPFTVTAPAPAASISGPATITPNTQPTIQFGLATPYPVDITGNFTLAFIPVNGSVADPAVQFSSGGTTFVTTVPAGQTTIPNLLVQSGTVAGTIRISLALTAGGVDVTPTGLAPLVITIPAVVPALTSVSLVRSGRQLTVNTVGFSNTREVTKATFHFTPATGQQIDTPDVTIDVSAIFNGWYSQTASAAYGSTFLYTQTFNLDDDAATVGQVTVTLSNGIGVSASGSSQ